MAHDASLCFTLLLVGYLTSCSEGSYCSSPLQNKPPRCSLRRDSLRRPEQLFCNGNITLRAQSFFRSSGPNPIGIVMCYLKGPGFDPTFLLNYPRLQEITVTNSNITHFTQDFPHHYHIQVVNLTRLQLSVVKVDTFLNLKALRVLDLSYNHIRYLNRVTLQVLNRLQKIYLKGYHWDCSLDLKWVLSKNSSSMAKKVVDLDQMYCGENSFPGKPVVGVMHFIKAVQLECPRKEGKECVCSLENVVWSQTSPSYLVPIIKVNCTGLGLHRLPHHLPPNTTTLLLSHNQISNISPLLKNPIYKTVSDIYLDYNKIEFVDNLEGAEWLFNFRVFSLRGNNIKKLTPYAFDNAFERNYHLAEIYLGHNPWTCDCIFTPGFKDLIVKYRIIIKDIYDVQCAAKNGDENSRKMIKDLSLTSMCRDGAEWWLKPIEIVNIILASLIVLVLGKFCYDYWVYKTSGKLPWIAMKIP